MQRGTADSQPTGSVDSKARLCKQARAAEGVDLAICSRTESAIQRAAEIADATGVTVYALAADLAQADEVARFAAFATERLTTRHLADARAQGVSIEEIERNAGRSEEVATVAVFLASDAASFVYGAISPVEGGASASSP